MFADYSGANFCTDTCAYHGTEYSAYTIANASNTSTNTVPDASAHKSEACVVPRHECRRWPWPLPR